MRLLVGLACFSVIAFVAYFFYGEWQRHELALQLAEAREAAAVAKCLSTADDLATVMRGEPLGRRFVQADARSELRECLIAGRLGAETAATLGL